MKAILEKIIAKQDLTQAEAAETFHLIMSGGATAAQVAGLIVALRMKGETADEIAGAASSMRKHAVYVDSRGLNVVDTCGTGGDSCGTFNVSTTAAFVVAGAGVPVAKHGNRAISSKCGSADVLAELGVNIEAPTEVVEECIQEAGFGFLFAPRLHPAMKHAMGPRRELGVRTIFNMLGPLTNPAGARCQVIGVFAANLTELFAQVLRLLGTRRALVVHGRDGMDEITVTSTTRISEVTPDGVRTYDFDPLGLIDDYASPESIRGGDPAANAAIVRAVLGDEDGPRRDIACLNAAAALLAAGKAHDMREGWLLARESVRSGRARGVLERIVEITQRA